MIRNLQGCEVRLQDVVVRTGIRVNHGVSCREHDGSICQAANLSSFQEQGLGTSVLNRC